MDVKVEQVGKGVVEEVDKGVEEVDKGIESLDKGVE